MDTYKTISKILQTYLQTYHAENAFNQILTLITKLAENSVPYILVSKENKALTLLAYSKKINAEYKNLLKTVPIDKNGSACASAAFYKKRIMIDNPIRHKAYNQLHPLVKKMNLKTCWAFPILNQKNDLVGTLSLYFTSEQKESNNTIKELEQILPFIAIIIDHDKKEQQSKEHNMLFNEIEKFSKSYKWEYNLETKEVWWSQNSYNLLKLDPKKYQPSYETFYNLLTKQSQQDMVFHVERILKTKQNQKLELRFKHLPDQIFYEEKKIICNKQGNPIKLIGIIKDITEERALEKERVSLNEKLQLLTDNVPGMVYSFKITSDMQAALLDCNDYIYNIYEITKEEAIKDVNLLFNQTKPQYQKALFESIENSRKRLTLFEFECEIKTPSGKEKWTTCQAWPKQQNNGSVIWTGIILDTTEKNRIKEEKKIAEQEAQKLEQEKDALGIELTQLIDTANAPIFGIDKAGNVNEWNQKAEEITGYSKKEVIGKTFVETYITKEYKAAVNDVLARAFQGEETANYEVPIYSKYGVRIIVLLNATTRRNTKGDVIGVVGVGQDITEINETKEELRSINRHFIQSQEASLTGSWEWDIHKNIIWWSDETYKIFEVNKAVFKKNYENYLDLLDKESQEKVNIQVKKILEDGQPYTHIIQLKRNKQKFLEGKGYLIKDEQGNNQKLIGIVKDISVEHKLETQLKESQEKRQELYKKIIVTQEDERKRLARDVHDDLGQQLAYLKIKLELAKKETIKGLSEIDDKNIKICGSSSCSNSLQELNESIEQLQKTIQTTREIAKELRPPQLDLLELKDLIESHINQLQAPNIKIKSEIKINENEISTAIKETVYNISKEGLANAIKHARPKTIKIVLKSNKNEISLEVIDDGRGFKHDDIIKPGSFGLIGIEEQLVPLNGAFTIKHHKQKTILETRIPI